MLDVVLLCGLLLLAIRGAQRGALFQVASFGGATAGLLTGAWVAPLGAAALLDGPGAGLALLTLALLAGCVFIGQAVGTALGARLRAAVRKAGAGGADRTAGIAVGVSGLVLLVWLTAGAFARGPLRVVAEQVHGSQVVATLDRALPTPPDVFARVGSYLDRQGFPQVFSGFSGAATAPPVDPPAGTTVRAASEAGEESTVQVAATGCGGVSLGSGFVPSPGVVVTNAHVVAGGVSIHVRDRAGTHEATPLLVDPDTDLAVLSAPNVEAPAIAWAGTPAERGTQGAVLGYPGGQYQLDVLPAAVRERVTAVGRDIYGRGSVSRDVLILSAAVQRGDSGGPFVTAEGDVAGVVFAAADGEPGTGYALTAESVRSAVSEAVERGEMVATGSCRF